MTMDGSRFVDEGVVDGMAVEVCRFVVEAVIDGDGLIKNRLQSERGVEYIYLSGLMGSC